MSENNLLAKLQQKRNRPTVERFDPLLPAVTPIVETIEESAETTDTPEATDNTEITEQLETDNNIQSRLGDSDEITIAFLKQKLETYGKTRRRSGIILDETIDDEISAFCQANKITVETFLEAAWGLISSKEDLKKKVIKESKARYNKRKEAGTLRRQITQLENLKKLIKN
ncbi:hypothetical protein [Gloeothece verrucosa]|uniref:Uncharacterized protein n=1 Tax=Gloeothece verrucosa (strain PCC 7822) TaxID=497965 RepID=E0UNC0_GLOV7|nr:hypothetical protein [Gloeothece verrucosa]ADN18450.1 conserved hypothetical protein [Gloeothece verrucosa PCC 7822]